MGIRSDYLDLAIGLAVVFFLTSLLVSGLNEGLQWAFRVRSKFLWAYLYDLVDPTRQKILPRRWGIFHLWRPGLDPRPTVQPGDVAGPPATAPTGGAATGADPHQLVCDLARALDPLDVP